MMSFFVCVFFCFGLFERQQPAHELMLSFLVVCVFSQRLCRPVTPPITEDDAKATHAAFFCFFLFSVQQIATLKVRIRSAEEDVETARRESFLEGHARSAAELAGAGKKAAEACSTAEALRQRCERQVRTGGVCRSLLGSV